MATGKRLISIDEALEATHKEVFWTESEKAAVRSFLAKLPGVDAVEVVRCKDCRYCMKDSHGLWCFNDYEHNLQPNDFCSYGERKDND